MKAHQSIGCVMEPAQVDTDVAVRDKVKILLVDDTPENLLALEAALESLGEELVLARSGKEALRYLLDHDCAAILLDVKMPEMDGFETAELIRSRPRSRHTPILFLTGYKNEEHLFRGYSLGAVDFLFKPIVPEILRSKVAVFVELSRNTEMLQRQAAAMAHQTAILQRAERRFRSLLEAAPDAMVICREDGRIVLINSRTESLFCYRREDLLGQNMRVLVPEWTADIPISPQEEHGDRTRRAGTEARETRAIRQDGSMFPAEISLSPLTVEDGLLITSAIRDITERKRVEQERAAAEEKVRELNTYLAELNAHLEERVALRTQQLSRSNEELAQFAYVASHDLREPLRTVSLYTQLLGKRYGGELQGDAHQFMDYIVQNAQRMELLVQDLLEFCKVDGRASDHFSLISCEAALDQALANLNARIEEAQAVISRDALPNFVGDPVQITSVFQNLVANSIKYRIAGEPPTIHIAAAQCGREWVFSVRDNGIGIDPQYSEKIFGIFKRLHGRENPGTGMGLAICKKIVERHGGRIWVESQPGHGATFYFTIPASHP
jgi:PAS domain S-box-containing protein